MISVITPSHNCLVLLDAYRTLQEQSLKEWEWVVLLNGGAKISQLHKDILNDERVKVTEMEVDIGRVGALKRMACKEATGDIIVELDHDDLLTPDALAEVAQAFRRNPDACFAYSNFSQVREDWSDFTFGEGFGWEYRPFLYKGHSILEVLSPVNCAQNNSLVWFAPNHVRAWKTEAYWAVGGHDQSLKIVDDQDLICRLYLYGKFIHIPKCLYIYRVHATNTWLQYNAEIQEQTWTVYDKYATLIAEKWSNENNLLKIDLCGGLNKPAGYMSVDLVGGDISFDLNKYPWPFEDNSVGIVRAVDALEHLKDPIAAMNEIHRILAHGGFTFFSVPSTDGRGAFQDPSHVSFWNENSFWYYTNNYYKNFLRGRITCKFQVRKLITHFPNEFCKAHNIAYVEAHLLATKKGGCRFHGEE